MYEVVMEEGRNKDLKPRGNTEAQEGSLHLGANCKI